MKNVVNTTLATYNSNSMFETQRLVLSSFLSKCEFSIPAIVKEYDRSANMAIVQPAISNVSCNTDENGNEILVERSCVRVPVANYGGGGIFINFPLSKGDTGRLIASDRNTELFNQRLRVSPPNYVDSGKYRYGFFLPDKIVGFPVDDSDENGLVIGTTDGSLKIVIDNGSVKEIRITGNVSITGDLNVSGTITSEQDVLGGTVSLTQHTHGGVQGGGGNTSPPNQ